jgi:hypothetical protein
MSFQTLTVIPTIRSSPHLERRQTTKIQQLLEKLNTQPVKSCVLHGSPLGLHELPELCLLSVRRVWRSVPSRRCMGGAHRYRRCCSARMSTSRPHVSAYFDAATAPQGIACAPCDPVIPAQRCRPPLTSLSAGSAAGLAVHCMVVVYAYNTAIYGSTMSCVNRYRGCSPSHTISAGFVRVIASLR